MRRLLALLALLSAAPLVPAVARADPQRHFAVVASFVPARKAGGVANVAVSFRALDPDLRLNESPAPRLTLDLEQTVLLDRQPPRSAAQESSAADYDPLTARYHDLAKPVLFPVAIAPTAPRGERLVKARLVFFYCSQREAWCRRGTRDLEIPVSVR
jgi:hypothetical protein